MSALAGDPAHQPAPGTVFLVGAGPGDPGLLTLRGLECLRAADVVVYDRLVNPSLLHYAPHARRIDVGKSPSDHPIPQDEINVLLVSEARQGRQVVRLKGGDPFVFGRGGEEALALAEASIPFEIVPGVTSAVAAPAYAGIPVTQREVAGSLTIIAGQRSSVSLYQGLLENPALGADTLVFLMGVENLPVIVRALLGRGLSPQTPIALIEQGTTPRQKVVAGCLDDILERSAGIRPPAVAVVGQVVRLREKLAWFENIEARPLLGVSVLNTRPQEPGQPDEFSLQLQRLGALVCELPAMRLAPPPDRTDLDAAIRAQADGSGWDWIVFSSANAVRFFLERTLELGWDLRILAGARLGALGEATARTLGEYHLKADFTPTRYSAGDWAAQAPQLSGCRVLLPCSGVAGPELSRALEDLGARVERLTAYTPVSAEPDAQILAMVEARQHDVLAFFSPSALRGVFAMLAEAFGESRARLALVGARIACIGQTTSAAVEALGFQAAIVAEEQTAAGLVKAILKWRMP